MKKIKIGAKNLKASVLAVSLVIMGVMIIIALGISSASVQSRKSSIGSSRSNVAFQAADSGVEAAMQRIRDHIAEPNLNNVDNSDGLCDGVLNSPGTPKKYRAELRNTTGIVACGASVASITKVKSTGYHGQDTRAVEAEVVASDDCSGKGNTAPGGGLRGFWRLDDGLGPNANDSSTQNNDGTLNGPTWSAGFASFDGNDDYIQTAANDMYDLFDYGTLIVWAKFNNLTSSTYSENTFAAYSAMGGGDSLIEWDAEIDSGNLRIQQAWKTKAAPGTWNKVYNDPVLNPITIDSNCHMVAFVADGISRTRIYYDGVLLQHTKFEQEAGVGDERDFISDVNNISSYAHHFNIGAWQRNSASTQRYFRGPIGEVQIYNQALTGPEISNIYIN